VPSAIHDQKRALFSFFFGLGEKGFLAIFWRQAKRKTTKKGQRKLVLLRCFERITEGTSAAPWQTVAH
jgi:uncharacterized membrane protein YeiB